MVLKNKKLFIKNYNLEQLTQLVVSNGFKSFRAKQLYSWLYQKYEDNPYKMKNLSSKFQKYINSKVLTKVLEVNNIVSTECKKTNKFLLKTIDGNLIESVSIIDEHRHTVCISSQIGCNVDCDFCATAKMGLIRNLEIAEIVEQLILVKKQISKPITNIVFMGMGEPFLNYNRVLQAADIFHDPLAFNIASKKITISTSGVFPKIKQFILEKRKYSLAISLNSVNNEVRTKLMPLNKKWPINDIVEFLRENYKNRNNLMFEYVLIKDINDSIKDAENLADVLSGYSCIINIIPYNDINGIYQRPSNYTIDGFTKTLYEKQKKYQVTVRWSKGDDIAAGCGQLATENI